jgi:hypothetical protein
MSPVPPTDFPAGGPNLTPLFILFFVGFGIALLGHGTGSRTLVAAGLVMVAVATFAIPIMAFLVY